MNLPPFNPPPLPYQSKQTRDWLSLFGPYLAHQLLVFSPARNRYGLLCGLPCVNVGQERPWADVLLFGTEKEAQRTITVDFAQPVCNILPVLRSFEDLCTPTVHEQIPAIEIGKAWCRSVNRARMEENYENGGPTCVIEGPGYELSISKSGFEQGRLGDQLAQQLRSWHFCLSLTADQYHRMPQQAPVAA